MPRRCSTSAADSARARREIGAYRVTGIDYMDSGIMDRTHLRFFILRTAHALLREAGLAIFSVRQASGITRAVLPLIKRFFFKSGFGAVDPGEILNSPSYRLFEGATRRNIAQQALARIAVDSHRARRRSSRDQLKRAPRMRLAVQYALRIGCIVLCPIRSR
jgi:hypothetical protein